MQQPNSLKLLAELRKSCAALHSTDDTKYAPRERTTESVVEKYQWTMKRFSGYAGKKVWWVGEPSKSSVESRNDQYASDLSVSSAITVSYEQRLPEMTRHRPSFWKRTVGRPSSRLFTVGRRDGGGRRRDGKRRGLPKMKTVWQKIHTVDFDFLLLLATLAPTKLTRNSHRSYCICCPRAFRAWFGFEVF